MSELSDGELHMLRRIARGDIVMPVEHDDVRLSTARVIVLRLMGLVETQRDLEHPGLMKVVTTDAGKAMLDAD